MAETAIKKAEKNDYTETERLFNLLQSLFDK